MRSAFVSLGILALFTLSLVAAAAEEEGAEDVFHAIATGDVAWVEAHRGEIDPHRRDEVGMTPLMRAAGLGHVEIVEVLLDLGADPNAVDRAVAGPVLHYAAQGGSVPTARALLAAGAHLNTQATGNGLTALMIAVWYRQPQMVEFLLAQPGVSVDARAHFGARAEDLVNAAVVTGRAGAQAELPPDARRMQELFRRHAAKQKDEASGQALLRLLTVAASDMPAAERLARVEALLEAGADPNVQAPVQTGGNDDHTPLLIASRDGYPEVVEALLAAGADPTIPGALMRAVPSHKAAYNGHADVLRLLAGHPSWPEIRDAQGPYNGYTPLHDAVWHGHLEAVRALLESGARVDLVAWDGTKAIDLARRYAYDEVVRLLETASAR